MTLDDFRASVHTAALAYSARGWSVVPMYTIGADGTCTCGTACGKDAGKHTWVKWRKAATTDPAKIDEWFGAKAPPRNLAIVTGAVSGVTVIDIDGVMGATTWQGLIGEHGEPVTLMARTGSGGMHVLFRYNAAFKNKSGLYGPDSHVDCRNDKGYILAPPSRHRSGGAYAWLNTAALADLPAHLVPQGPGRPKSLVGARDTFAIETVRDMLTFIPPDDRDLWRAVGVILGRTFTRHEEAWTLYNDWSNTWTGEKKRGHDLIMHEAFYEVSQKPAQGKELSMGTLIKLAVDKGWVPKGGEVPVERFIYYAPGNKYIYRVTTQEWIAHAVDAMCTAVSVNGKLVKPTAWVERHQATTSMTDDPGIDGDLVKGYDCRHGELFESKGSAVFNKYQPPRLEPGDARLADPFVAHVRRVMPLPGDADQFFNYLAHRVQWPSVKPRFALLLAGVQGSGKDTAVEMCCPSIGDWNVANIEPQAFDTAFNEYAGAVLVRISETNDLHEMSRWAFNERTKVLIAGNPDHCTINPKYGEKYSVRMHCGVILTTNSLLSGMYIPTDDRRYDVIESATFEDMGLTDEDVKRTYFEDLWEWFYQEQGAGHILAFLLARDLSQWNAATGQRKTAAHRMVVATGLAPDMWLADLLDELGTPDYINGDYLVALAECRSPEQKRSSFTGKIVAAMVRQGYTKNDHTLNKDGRWKIKDKQRVMWRKLSAPRTADIGILTPFVKDLII